MLLDLLKSKDASDNLGYDTSIFKVRLNSQKFKVFYEVEEIQKGYYQQVGVTARYGIMILYKYPDSDTWYNLDSYGRRNAASVNMKKYNIDKHVPTNGEYQLMILGPILSQLKTLKIQVPENSTVQLDNELSERKVVIAGGIYSKGIGCTTAGLRFSNILSRNLDLSVMDLTYKNRKSYLKDIHDFYENNIISQADVGVLELHYALQDDEIVNEYLKDVIRYMKKQCVHLICWYCLPKTKLYKQAVIYDNLMDELEDDNIEVMDFSFLHDEQHGDMCTASPYFITDAAHVLIYQKLRERIQEVTKWNI
ncbi:MAG: hypothetical protein BZ138_00695 [Methanosphaera sp. rholeuAM270]|nr:MAG: hypothetical protein BZ138_00695 [Methanosphaera sp. rholeuAM270]